jgi:hypothetical protein
VKQTTSASFKNRGTVPQYLVKLTAQHAQLKTGDLLNPLDFDQKPDRAKKTEAASVSSTIRVCRFDATEGDYQRRSNNFSHERETLAKDRLKSSSSTMNQTGQADPVAPTREIARRESAKQMEPRGQHQNGSSYDSVSGFCPV